MVKWPGGQVVRWSGGLVARWPGGQVARWSGGQVARWPGGQVARGYFPSLRRVLRLASGRWPVEPWAPLSCAEAREQAMGGPLASGL